MKKISIILISVMVALVACTKSKEVHPELGDGNDEIVTVGSTTAHVEYIRADIADLNKVVFHYGLSEAQTFETATMTKKESFFELTLNNLLSDTLYHYYYELFPNNGNATLSGRKTFRTMAPGLPEPPTPPSIELPTVVTMEVSEITNNSAMCGGDVTNDGGAEITERGICWSTNENPTLNDNHIAVGNGIGTFTETINGLVANTTYHVRAYATNEAGTAYGLDKMFNTLSASGNAPVGAINGLFTINENGDQVYFSQGNLQYQASTNTWRFAENQWDYVGDEMWGTVFYENTKCNNNLVSSTYNGWIDLFAWGTSGYDHGAICYQPWINHSNPAHHNAYGSPTYNLFDKTGQADWGYNSIVNGGSELGLWRTITFAELYYIFELRSTNSGIRYAKAEVNEVQGYLIIPDDCGQSLSFLSVLNQVNEWAVNYNVNTISLYDWTFLESNGVVFIPAAGYRECEDGLVHGMGGVSCGYWCSSVGDGVYAHCLYSYTGPSGYSWPFPGSSGNVRNFGYSVRLVQDANK